MPLSSVAMHGAWTQEKVTGPIVSCRRISSQPQETAVSKTAGAISKEAMPEWPPSKGRVSVADGTKTFTSNVGKKYAGRMAFDFPARSTATREVLAAGGWRS
jgi:hypothetical protein